jgi:hypothetical protein
MAKNKGTKLGGSQGKKSKGAKTGRMPLPRRSQTRLQMLESRLENLESSAGDLAEQLRKSEAVKQARATGNDVAERVAKAEPVAVAQERGGHLAKEARRRVEDADHDDKVADLSKRLQKSPPAQQAREAKRELANRDLRELAERPLSEAGQRAGQRLAGGKAGQRLGIKPARRRWQFWVLALAGVGIGYGIGVLTAPRRGEVVRDELVRSAERLGQDTADHSAPPAEKPLADKVRTRLGEDPRTSQLPKLNVNVAEGTVFVRGSVPDGFDETVIRDVISTVPGVEDIDLQLEG